MKMKHWLFVAAVIMGGMAGGVCAFVARAAPELGIGFFVGFTALAIALVIAPMLMLKIENGR